MRRRELIAAFGVGASTMLAGCQEVLTSDEPDEDTPQPPKQESDRVVDKMVLDIIDLVDITADKFTVDMHFGNRDIEQPIQLHAYKNTITAETPAEWEFKTVYHGAGTGPAFDTEETEWLADPDRSHVRPELVLDNKEEHQSTVEIPSNPDFPIRFENDRDNPETYLVDFELDEEPPMHQLFLYTFELDLSNFDDAEFDGAVVARTPHIMRVGENDFIFPLWHNGENPLEDPNWSRYSGNEVYHTELSHETRDGEDMTVGQVTRVSNYGIFGEKYREIAEEGRRHDLNYGNGATLPGDNGHPHYLRTPYQVPWSIEYEVPTSVMEESAQTAESILQGASNDDEAVWSMVNSDEAMNHSIVQNVASQLGDVCEQMQATGPAEQLRVVADFVQYMGYSVGTGTADTPGAPENARLAPGTNHPVTTLGTGVGDCKDFTVLGEALLQQDPFNFTVSEACFDNITRFNWNQNSPVGHVSIGVAFDDLGISGVEEDMLGNVPLGTKTCMFTDQGTEYLYVETSSPHPLGVVGEHPDYEVPPNPLRGYV